VSAAYAETGPVRRLVRRVAATGPVSRVLARTLHHADRAVYRWTRGRTTLAAVIAGLPVIMLTTRGARTGRPATTPLLAVVEGETIIVVGSNFGRPHHPAWIHNLRADPRAQVEVEGRTREVVAEEVAGAERERYIAQAAELYPGFPAYVKRAAPRQIAVIRLT
jgi:deazaflavin-dependent oxidoreductase (nitroreductase family)